MSRFVCFGEVLWDVFPDAEKIGGAPLNVALRLKSFDNEVAIISGIGKDEYGQRLQSFLEERDLSIDHLLIHEELETGKVMVHLDEKGSASYTINFPAAWDFIKSTSENEAMVKSADALIFGSLVMRHEVSRDSLLKLIDSSNYNIFDVNLRPPHYSIDMLAETMGRSNFVKFNDDEILEIGAALGCKETDLVELIKFFVQKFKLETVCVTRGDKGAILFHENEFYEHSGFPVTVMDTVGAGDSFLATLINGVFEGNSPSLALEKACAVGAMVASSEGANPLLTKKQIDQFIKSYD